MRFLSVGPFASFKSRCPVPLFYFDYTDDDGFYRDNEGSDLLNFKKARDLAISILPDISNARFRRRERREFSVTVRDDTGKTIYRATMTVQGKSFH